MILLLALVVLGPEKLPDAIRRFGRTYAELKKMGSGFQSELKSALDEPVNEMRKTADLVRDAADPDKIAAESAAERTAAADTSRDAEDEAAARADSTAAAISDDPGATTAVADEDHDEPSVATPTPQGDPPLVRADDEPVGAEDPSVVHDDVEPEPPVEEPAPRVNRIAAANSSGAIAASAEEAAAAAAASEITAPAGPAFHSAGPRNNGDRSDAELADDGTAGSEETSDEAAPA